MTIMLLLWYIAIYKYIGHIYIASSQEGKIDCQIYCWGDMASIGKVG